MHLIPQNCPSLLDCPQFGEWVQQYGMLVTSLVVIGLMAWYAYKNRPSNGMIIPDKSVVAPPEPEATAIDTDGRPRALFQGSSSKFTAAALAVLLISPFFGVISPGSPARGGIAAICLAILGLAIGIRDKDTNGVALNRFAILISIIGTLFYSALTAITF